MRSLSLLMIVGLFLCSCRPAGDRADSGEALSEAGAPGAGPRRSVGNPVAKGAENVVLPPVEDITDTPPPDLNQSNTVVSPQPAAGAARQDLPTNIPDQFRGRWALVPADCTSTRGDAKGLLTINDNRLTFYESKGTLDRIDSNTPPNRLVANFGFSGEGMTWGKVVTLERTAGKLRRFEPAADGQPAVDLTYTRCPS